MRSNTFTNGEPRLATEVIVNRKEEGNNKYLNYGNKSNRIAGALPCSNRSDDRHAINDSNTQAIHRVKNDLCVHVPAVRVV